MVKFSKRYTRFTLLNNIYTSRQNAPVSLHKTKKMSKSIKTNTCFLPKKLLTLLMAIMLWNMPAAKAQSSYTVDTFNMSNTPVLTTDFLTTVAVGSEHTIWIGTLNQGLYRFSYYGNSDFVKAPYLTNHGIRHIMADNDGGIFVGQSGSSGAQAINGGVDYFPDTGFSGHIHFDALYAQPNPLQTRYVRALYPFNDKVYVSNSDDLTAGNTRMGGMSIIDGISESSYTVVRKAANSFSDVEENPYNVDGAQMTAIAGVPLAEDSAHIWLAAGRNCHTGGSCYSPMIMRFDMNNAQVDAFDETNSFDENGNPVLPFVNAAGSPTVRAMIADANPNLNQRVWVGMSNGLIAVYNYDYDTGYWTVPDLSALLPAGTAISANAMCTGNGRVYIGTTNGLLIFNGGDITDPASYTLLTMDDGLSGNNITGIAVVDELHDIWCSSGSGLMRIHEETECIVEAVISPQTDTTICEGESVQFHANAQSCYSYQWQKDGFDIGDDASSFTATESGSYRVIVSNIDDESDVETSVSVMVTVLPIVTPHVIIATDTNSVCEGSMVTFTADTANGGSNPLIQWLLNDNPVGSNSTTFSTDTLTDGDIIRCVLTNTDPCATPPSDTSNTITMTVIPAVTPTVSITADNTEICAGTEVSFNATATNEGSSPTYQWKKNDTNVGTNSDTYSSSALADDDVITCTLTSNANCPLPENVTSSGITMTVNPVVTPAISIVADDTVICGVSDVTFTATITDGGTDPVFQWKKNGMNVGTNSNTFTTALLTNGDVITCMLTSNAECTTQDTITSAGITMTLLPLLSPPSISINADNTEICSGMAVTFTATDTNGGSSPAYQWKKNGTNVGTNSATYSSSTLANGDVITCTLTSNANCILSTNVVTSSGITMVVNPSVTPAISIAANNTEICAGTAVTFTATATNGGGNPVYQWKKNGTNVGSNSATYSSTTLANDDVITCVLTSNATCVSPASVTSSGITMTVNPVLTPAISIAANNTEICAGTAVTFTATATNGGGNPVYQWKKNGTNVGSNSATYSSTTLVDDDVITCMLTSNAACVSPASATSSGITMTVNPVLTPAISIAANNTEICAGTVVTFTATATNGGGNPVYQWKKNGTNVGVNSATYSSTALADDDVITCVLTSNATCTSPASVTSSGITMTVNPTVIPIISIAADNEDICAGTEVIFTATATNGGSSPVYQWKKNGTNVGDDDASYITSDLSDGDVITCVLTSNAACADPGAVTSSAITLTVNPMASPTISISADPETEAPNETNVTFTATVIDEGDNPQYTWFRNGTNIPGINSVTYIALAGTDFMDGDTISACLISDATCALSDTAWSNELVMEISGVSIDNVNKDASALFSLYPNPNNGRFIIEGPASGRGSYNLSISNVLGQKVYTQTEQVNGNKLRVEIAAGSLTPGIYFLEIAIEGKRVVVKQFVVK